MYNDVSRLNIFRLTIKYIEMTRLLDSRNESESSVSSEPLLLEGKKIQTMSVSLYKRKLIVTNNCEHTKNTTRANPY